MLKIKFKNFIPCQHTSCRNYGYYYYYRLSLSKYKNAHLHMCLLYLQIYICDIYAQMSQSRRHFLSIF